MLANPPASGLGTFFWIGPILVVVLGLFVFVRQMQKLQAESTNVEKPVNTSIPEPSSGDSYRDRIEQELRRKA